MLTQDFSGVYDYEKTEAHNAAAFILEDLAEGFMTHEELPQRIERTRTHWSRMLNNPQMTGNGIKSFAEFDHHFHDALRAGGVAI